MNRFEQAAKSVTEINKNYECGFITSLEYLGQLTSMLRYCGIHIDEIDDAEKTILPIARKVYHNLTGSNHPSDD